MKGVCAKVDLKDGIMLMQEAVAAEPIQFRGG